MTVRSIDSRVASLPYDAANFRDLYEAIGHLMWEFMRSCETVIRMETATFLDRAAVEPLGPTLLEEFGDAVNEDRTRQMIGHMARQVMAELGYEVDRPSLRLTRVNMFTTAAGYRPEGEKSARGMAITREQRDAWAAKTAKSPFNIWLNAQVRDADGKLDEEKLYAVARDHGVTEEYRNLNKGQQRMNIGARLRAKVDPSVYGG